MILGIAKLHSETKPLFLPSEASFATRTYLRPQQLYNIYLTLTQAKPSLLFVFKSSRLTEMEKIIRDLDQKKSKRKTGNQRRHFQNLRDC